MTVTAPAAGKAPSSRQPGKPGAAAPRRGAQAAAAAAVPGDGSTAPPSPSRRRGFTPLTPMRLETAKQMTKLADNLKDSHPDMLTHQHVRDAARMLRAGNEEAAQRHLRAAMFSLTPQSLMRHGLHTDDAHNAARQAMHGVHRHLLLVKDIQDTDARNRAAAQQPGGDKALNAPARMNSGGSDMTVASPVGTRQFARTWDELAAALEFASARRAPGFATIPRGTPVSWHYRSAIGHGTVKGIEKLGTRPANTMYDINEHDHHVSATGSREKPVVVHSGQALTRTSARAAKGGKPGRRSRVRAAVHAEMKRRGIGMSVTRDDLTLVIDLVGPHGYEHNWVFIGIPAPGSKVRFASGHHAVGTVEKTDATHVHVRMQDGSVTRIPHNGKPGPGKLTRAAAGDEAKAAPKGILSGPHPADKMTTATDKRAAAKSLSDSELKAADQELARRATALGKPGQLSKSHKAVAVEMAKRGIEGTAVKRAPAPEAPKLSAEQQALHDLAAKNGLKVNVLPFGGGSTSTHLLDSHGSAVLSHSTDHPGEVSLPTGKRIPASEAGAYLAAHKANPDAHPDYLVDQARGTRGGVPLKRADRVAVPPVKSPASPGADRPNTVIQPDEKTGELREWSQGEMATAASRYAQTLKPGSAERGEIERQALDIARGGPTWQHMKEDADALRPLVAKPSAPKAEPSREAKLSGIFKHPSSGRYAARAESEYKAGRYGNALGLLEKADSFESHEGVPAGKGSRQKIGRAITIVRAAQAAAIRKDRAASSKPAAQLAYGRDGLARAVELSARTAQLEVTPAPYGKPGGPGLYGVAGNAHSPYFEQIVKALMEKRGMDKAAASKIAWGALRRWSRGGGHVTPEVRAAAAGGLALEKVAEARAHAHAVSWDDISGDIGLATVLEFFNPDQMRVPAGQAGGGRFGSAGGQSAAAKAPAKGSAAKTPVKGAAVKAASVKTPVKASASAAPVKPPAPKPTAAQTAHQAHVAHVAHVNKVSTAKAELLVTAQDDRVKASALIKQRDALAKALASASGKTSSGQAGAVTSKNATTKTTASAAKASTPKASAAAAPKASTSKTSATSKTSTSAKASTGTPSPSASKSAQIKAKISQMNTQIAQLLAAAEEATLQASRMQ